MAALLALHCKPGSTLGPIKLGPQLALTVYLPEPTRTSTQWALSPSRELLEGIFTGCFSTMGEHSVDIATAAMRAMQPSFPFLCCFSFVDFFVCAAFLVFTHFSCTLRAFNLCVHKFRNGLLVFGVATAKRENGAVRGKEMACGNKCPLAAASTRTTRTATTTGR